MQTHMYGLVKMVMVSNTMYFVTISMMENRSTGQVEQIFPTPYKKAESVDFDAIDHVSTGGKASQMIS